MYAGRVVERARPPLPSSARPRHPYAAGLLASIPARARAGAAACDAGAAADRRRGDGFLRLRAPLRARATPLCRDRAAADVR